MPLGLPTRIFIWLAGAGEEDIRNCPSWERRKYVALGATVLVPCLFALIASAYAVHTLTTNRYVIAAVTVVWGFIILTIDRALLATYRAYQSHLRKLAQFSLRVLVAALMGMTISHPLTLLLFRDTLTSVIEKDREAEMDAVRAATLERKKMMEEKIAAMNAEVAELQEQWGATFKEGFKVEEDDSKRSLEEMNQDAMALLLKSITEARAPTGEKIQEAEKAIAALTEQSRKVQEELDFWQKEFERELNGQRSGIVGLGPRAKSIQSDQLEGRRRESERLAGLLREKTADLGRLRVEEAEIERQVKDEYRSKAAEQDRRQREEQARLDQLNRQVQGRQVDEFVEHQKQSRHLFKTQIDSLLEQSRQAQGDLAKLDGDEQARIAVIRAEPRRDLLRQTLALRRLFQDSAQGGRFALTTYLVLTLLFMLIDTIPLVLKFFSKPGPYDTIVDRDEVHYNREREAFLRKT